jgi:hypothetical protein
MMQLRDMSNENLGELANEIAARHPLNRLRKWTKCDVAKADTRAILDAMAIEAQLTQGTMAVAAQTLLARLDAWDTVPRGKWQLVAAIPRFYEKGDYRLSPEELLGVINER